MSRSRLVRLTLAAIVMAAIAGGALVAQQKQQERKRVKAMTFEGKNTGSLVNADYVPETPKEVQSRLGFDPSKTSIIGNPYEHVRNWPKLGNISPGGAIGIVPDQKGGVWLQHRSETAVVHINAAGDVDKSWPGISSGRGEESGNATWSYAHGLCQDSDGNFWALDSGTFGNTGDTGKKGNTVQKYSPEGKLLLTLGKPGVGIANGATTFISPSACIQTPSGNMLIADGHWSRPNIAQQDGDRLVWITRDGKFVKQYGNTGTGPGEFLGVHGMAFDSKKRLFVTDRANNRIQIFDNENDMTFLDDWKHFGRPSMIWILKDDTLIVADSESQYYGFRPANLELGPTTPGSRNAGWRTGIWIGSAKDGSIRGFISGTNPEGLGVDEAGNVFAGLTGQCKGSVDNNCLQKYVLRKNVSSQ
jgi:sugar lactone lactonase YvrE